MPHVLRPLSLGQLLDETFNIYKQNFVLFIGISAIPNLALLLLKLLLIGTSVINNSRTDALNTLVVLLVTILGAVFVSSIVTAATTFGVSDVYLDIPTSMTACFSRVSGKALRVIYTSFLVGLIIGFGTLLCVIPGIYLAGMYGLAIPAVVLEDITASDSLGRSSALTKNSVGRIIVIYFLTTIFAAIMVTILNVAGLSIGATALHGVRTLSGSMLQEVTATLGTILFGPVTAIALTLAYYDQRVRNEAFDITHMMSLMGVPESLPATPPPIS
ncbi:MAG TPA: hypothetical protein VGN44_03105 [Candidatus Angelobacter sp.]|jgi:hypothetical protein